MLNSRERLKGKLVVITGAGRGIGRSIAESVLAQGARVVVTDFDTEAIHLACNALKGMGAVYGFPLDVTDNDSFTRTIDEIEQTVGAIDVLINNAGIMMLGGFTEQPLSVDQRQIDVNLMGVIHGTRAVLPHMTRRNRGHVVNIASVAGRVGCPYAAVYSATKFAVVGLTEALHLEYRGRNIHFSYVMPAVVKTSLTEGTTFARWPPPLRPEEVADAVVHEALLNKKVEVFVPPVSRLSTTLPALLPRTAYEALGRFFKVDQLFANPDAKAREDYRSRSLG